MANDWGQRNTSVNGTRESGDDRTNRPAINAAPGEDISRQERLRLIEAFGTVDFRDDWDYKADRRRDAAHRKVND